MYGEKSFFHRRREGLLDVPLPDDDPDPEIAEEEPFQRDASLPDATVQDFAEEGMASPQSASSQSAEV